MPWRKQSYEVLPALSVRGPELRRSLRVVTQGWMLGVVWMACVSGSQMKIFARMLGYDDFAFGVLAAIPFIATFGQLIASVLIEATGLRKYQFLQCGTLHRLLWLVVAAIPLIVGVPSAGAVGLSLAVLAVSWFMASLSTPAWLTWMGDLIPRRIRGRYFASRLRWTEPVRVVVVIAIGVILDAVSHDHLPETAAAQPVLLYTICGIFAVAALFGAADILIFRRIREVLPRTVEFRKPAVEVDVPPPARWTPVASVVYLSRAVRSIVRQLLVEPLGDRVFRHYVLYGATTTFSISVSMWFYWLNAMENLGFSKTAVNFLFLVLGPLLGMSAARLWGTLTDRWGRRPVLIVCSVTWVFAALPWFFVTPQTPHPQFVATAANWLAGLVGTLIGRPGMVWITDGMPVGAYLGGMIAVLIGWWSATGINLAQTGVLLGFSDSEGRSKYVAASAVLMSFGGILGGAVGGVVAQQLSFLQADPIRWGPMLWNNWHATFLLSMLARAAAIGWLIGMPDPGAVPVRQLLRTARANAYNAVAPRLFYSLRIFGWGRGDNRRNDMDDDTGTPDDRPGA